MGGGGAPGGGGGAPIPMPCSPSSAGQPSVRLFKISLRYLDFMTLLLFASFVAVVVLFHDLLLQGKLGLLKKIKRENILNSAFLDC